MKTILAILLLTAAVAYAGCNDNPCAYRPRFKGGDVNIYRGRLSENPYGRDSTSNEFGRYGSLFSSPSINNDFGAGSRFAREGSRNPFGDGLPVFSGE